LRFTPCARLNDYLYQILLLTSPGKMTVALMQAICSKTRRGVERDDGRRDIYALPPIAIFYALRRCNRDPGRRMPIGDCRGQAGRVETGAVCGGRRTTTVPATRSPIR
jgi:hypothetical protein